MDWTTATFRAQVIALAEKCSTSTELRNKLVEQSGEKISADMLRNAWIRWQKSHGVSPMDEVLGRKLKPPKDDHGQSKLVYPSKTRLPEAPPDHFVSSSGPLPKNLLCDGDLHYPIHNPYHEAAKLKFAADKRVECHVNVGDAFDFWLLSQHEKNETDRVFNGKGLLQDEFNSAKPYWKEVCRISKDVHFILGNHENRLNRFIGANLWAYGLSAFELGPMAGLPEKVKIHNYGAQVKIGALSFEHGDRVGGRFGSQHPAHKFLQTRGNRNVIFGHTHKTQYYTRTLYDEFGEPHSYVSINQGHACDPKSQLYAGPEPDWTESFTYVDFWSEAGKPRFTAYPIIVVNGKFSFDGKLYNGHKL